MIFNLCGGGVDKSKGLTATVTDILKGKTALVDGEVLTGNYVPDTGYKVKTGVVTSTKDNITINSGGEFNIEGFWVGLNTGTSLRVYKEDDDDAVVLSFLYDGQQQIWPRVTAEHLPKPFAYMQAFNSGSNLYTINGSVAQVDFSSHSNTIKSGLEWFYICWGK